MPFSEACETENSTVSAENDLRHSAGVLFVRIIDHSRSEGRGKCRRTLASLTRRDSAGSVEVDGEESMGKIWLSRGSNARGRSVLAALVVCHDVRPGRGSALPRLISVSRMQIG
jgi:hypothetical protein